MTPRLIFRDIIRTINDILYLAIYTKNLQELSFGKIFIRHQSRHRFKNHHQLSWNRRYTVLSPRWPTPNSSKYHTDISTKFHRHCFICLALFTFGSCGCVMPRSWSSHMNWYCYLVPSLGEPCLEWEDLLLFAGTLDDP